jgi:AbrB family looped-hinge helix DNA binding protein
MHNGYGYANVILVLIRDHLGCNMESSLTIKGQMTIPRAAREHLGAKPGDRVKIFLHPNGTVVLLPKAPVSSLKGMFAGRVDKPVSVEEMEVAIEEGAAGDFDR